MYARLIWHGAHLSYTAAAAAIGAALQSVTLRPRGESARKRTGRARAVLLCAASGRMRLPPPASLFAAAALNGHARPRYTLLDCTPPT